MAGAFYKNLILDYVTDYAYSGGGGSPGSGIAIDDEGSKSTSLFGNGGYKVTHALEIGGGVRYFHDDRAEYDGILYRTGSFHSVDPRLYASYILSKGFHVYVNAADGFRSGGFNGGYGVPESTFAPEKVRSYEAGTKISMLGGRLAADAALFFSNYDNIQIYVNTPSGIGLLQNGGDAHIWGGDWSLEWQATDRLLFAFSGSATESKMVRLLPGVAVAKVGDPVDMTTDYTARLSGTYHFDIGQYLPGFFRLDYTDIGPSHLTDRGEGGPPILFRTAIMHMLDARIGVQRGEWEVDLFATNLLNANGIQDGDGAFGFGARPRPRTVGIEIRASTL